MRSDIRTVMKHINTRERQTEFDTFASYLQQIWRGHCHSPTGRQIKPEVLSKSQTSDSRVSWCPAEAWTGMVKRFTAAQPSHSHSAATADVPRNKTASWNMIKYQRFFRKARGQLIPRRALSPFKDAQVKRCLAQNKWLVWLKHRQTHARMPTRSPTGMAPIPG